MNALFFCAQKLSLDVEKLEGKLGTATYAEIKKYVADHNDGM